MNKKQYNELGDDKTKQPKSNFMSNEDFLKLSPLDNNIEMMVKSNIERWVIDKVRTVEICYDEESIFEDLDNYFKNDLLKFYEDISDYIDDVLNNLEPEFEKWKEKEKYLKYSFFLVQLAIILNVKNMKIRRALKNPILGVETYSRDVLGFIRKNRDNANIIKLDNWFNFCSQITDELAKVFTDERFFEVDVPNQLLEEYFKYLKIEKVAYKGFIHSDYYRTIKYNGTEYKLSIVQSSVIGYMHNKFKLGLTEIKGEEILTYLENDFSENYKRLRDIFKKSTLWNNFIKMSEEKRGYYYLDI